MCVCVYIRGTCCDWLKIENRRVYRCSIPLLALFVSVAAVNFGSACRAKFASLQAARRCVRLSRCNGYARVYNIDSARAALFWLCFFCARFVT